VAGDIGGRGFGLTSFYIKSGSGHQEAGLDCQA